MRNLISLPIQAILLIAIFGFFAYLQARYSTITTVSTLAWIATATGAFNFLAWANKKTTTLGQLRSLEYIYITVGLIGAAGVLEVQSTVLQARVKEIISHYYTENYNSSFCENIDKSGRRLTEECYAEQEFLAAYEDYNHERVKRFIDSYLNSSIEEVSRRASWLKQMYDEMEDQVYSHFLDPKSPWWLALRLIGFYMVIVGVAVKFAKTSAEIFGWHQISREKVFA